MKVIDFFCGLGGSATGAEWAGGRVVAAVNHWEIAARSFELNHGVKPLRQSMRNVGAGDLPRADALLFSPECTNHTDAKGAAPRDETSRNTAREVVRFVCTLAPRVFVVENVWQIRRWHRFEQWAADLAGLGYALNSDGRPGQLLNAADWGVPQARVRFFLVGVRAGCPQITSPGCAHRAVGECIDWRLPMGRVDARERSAKTRERIRQADEMCGDAGALLVYYGSGPQVLPLDRPCRTVTTRDRFALYRRGKMRMLQPPELRRIMGFPDSYLIAGTRAQQIMQLGNAVAPPVMRGILEQVA
jgi:DNA (cytosine-5)-methyltransferase 1